MPARSTWFGNRTLGDSFTFFALNLSATGLLLLVNSGCGRSGPPNKSLHAVIGTVKLANNESNQQLLDGALVEFHSAEGEGSGRKILGKVNEEGLFGVMTEENGEKVGGAPLGEFKVTFTKPEIADDPVPKQYRQADTTPITVEIRKGINRLEPIELMP